MICRGVAGYVGGQPTQGGTTRLGGGALTFVPDHGLIAVQVCTDPAVCHPVLMRIAIPARSPKADALRVANGSLCSAALLLRG